MKIVRESLIIIFISILFIFILESLTRILLIIPTGTDVLKYGFKRSVMFEIVDLSKLQIIITDKSKNFKMKKISSANDSKKNIWIFGGSTSRGENCEYGQSSSWPYEINKLNENFSFKNFSFNGANSDQQLNLLYLNINQYIPDTILWANKFNTKNILGQSEYRNKDILKYEFKDASKTRVIVNLKRIDKTMKKYLVSYKLIDEVIKRINIFFIHKKIFKLVKIEPSEKDILYSVKNFEINTKEAINLSKKNGVKEFFIVSLFSKDDFEEKRSKIIYYEKTIKELEKKYFPYVKVISFSEDWFNNIDISNLFCDLVHKTLEGEQLQARIIYKSLLENSKIFLD